MPRELEERLQQLPEAAQAISYRSDKQQNTDRTAALKYCADFRASIKEEKQQIAAEIEENDFILTEALADTNLAHLMSEFFDNRHMLQQ